MSLHDFFCNQINEVLSNNNDFDELLSIISHDFDELLSIISHDADYSPDLSEDLVAGVSSCEQFFEISQENGEDNILIGNHIDAQELGWALLAWSMRRSFQIERWND
jgi:hypothetical protein